MEAIAFTTSAPGDAGTSGPIEHRASKVARPSASSKPCLVNAGFPGEKPSRREFPAHAGRKMMGCNVSAREMLHQRAARCFQDDRRLES